MNEFLKGLDKILKSVLFSLFSTKTGVLKIIISGN
jgi:hypothetical protein